MLSNYVKIAVAVLLRRKFLSFVNLFGATLTLTVLVVAAAIFDSFANPAGAQRRQAQILTIETLSLTNSRRNMTWNSGPGFAFYERYIAPLETPDKVSYTTTPNATTSYVDGRKITPQLRRTDATYWEILSFDLLAGRVLSADDVDAGRFVAVVNAATAESYFPDLAVEATLGRSIAVESESFEIIGVVANEPETSRLAYADVWVPLTTAVGFRDQWIEGGAAMLYVDDPAKLRAVQREYETALQAFEYTVDPSQFDTAISVAATSLESIASLLLANTNFVDRASSRNLVGQFAGMAVVVILLFMLLPAINMANLNIGRILERAPEIGLRKAAGASTRVLVGQFVFENVVLATLGGALAFAIAPLVLGALNQSVFTYGRLTLSLPVLVAGLVLVVVFGVVSGAYPAWRMAKLAPASALRGVLHV